jgi:release factor glutamine methyltransferase
MPESRERRPALSAIKGAESNKKTCLSTTPAWQLRQAADYLVGCGISSARLDAEVLLTETLQTDRAGLYLRHFSPLAQEAIDKFWRLVGRRGKREPLPYITGKQEFWSLEFLVDPRVLIPRPETEGLVETGLRILQEEGSQQIPGKVKLLDIGTGSGCLAIALAQELPGAKIWAVDISAAALRVAKANTTRHKATKQITLLQGDLFAPVADQEGLFDLIVSNPPYVAEEEFSTLQEEVRKWEPRLALNGGKAGIDFHQRLIAESPRYLRQGGWLVMEIGQGQERAIARLAAERGVFTRVHFVKDYAGIDRVAAIQTKAVSGR